MALIPPWLKGWGLINSDGSDNPLFKDWLEAARTEINLKTNVVADGTEGNLVSLDPDGNIQDSGKKGSDFAEIVAGGTEDNFASLDAGGDIQDSGYAGANFSDSGHGHTLADVSDSGDMAAQNKATVDIDGGDIDGAAIGATSESTIKGSTVEASTKFIHDGTDGVDGSVTVLTAIQAGGGGALGIQYKNQVLTFSGGIITTVGAESGWNDI